jgi:hypothetical protein
MPQCSVYLPDKAYAYVTSVAENSDTNISRVIALCLEKMQEKGVKKV